MTENQISSKYWYIEMIQTLVCFWRWSLYQNWRILAKNRNILKSYKNKEYKWYSWQTTARNIAGA